jgi:hypothetical protein
LILPPTSRSISGEVKGKRLSARRADSLNVEVVVSPRSCRMAAAIASISSAARPAFAKLPTPNTRDNRSRTTLQSAAAPRTISIRPMSTRTAFTSRSDNAARRLRTSRATNHGRFLPLRAISW